jgi:hypothetical protein
VLIFGLAFQQKVKANPALSKFLPQLDFHRAKGLAQIGGFAEKSAKKLLIGQ